MSSIFHEQAPGEPQNARRELERNVEAGAAQNAAPPPTPSPATVVGCSATYGFHRSRLSSNHGRRKFITVIYSILGRGDLARVRCCDNCGLCSVLSAVPREITYLTITSLLST